jgi:hypothetical protein
MDHKDDPLNLKQHAARLEIRRNFFSSRAVDAWNMRPSVQNPLTFLKWQTENTK